MSRIWDIGGLKPVRFHPRAIEVLRTFPDDVRRAFGKAIYDLQCGHSLSMPLSRSMPSLDIGAAELRIRDSSCIYRAFYMVKVVDAILVFHAFMKKTQKTPEKELTLGKKHLREMLL